MNPLPMSEQITMIHGTYERKGNTYLWNVCRIPLGCYNNCCAWLIYTNDPATECFGRESAIRAKNMYDAMATIEKIIKEA